MQLAERDDDGVRRGRFRLSPGRGGAGRPVGREARGRRGNLRVQQAIDGRSFERSCSRSCRTCGRGPCASSTDPARPTTSSRTRSRRLSAAGRCSSPAPTCGPGCSPSCRTCSSTAAGRATGWPSSTRPAPAHARREPGRRSAALALGLARGRARAGGRDAARAVGGARAGVLPGAVLCQAAGRLGVRVPTVGTRLVRARAYLRMKLQKQIAAGSPLGKYVS